MSGIESIYVITARDKGNVLDDPFRIEIVNPNGTRDKLVDRGCKITDPLIIGDVAVTADVGNVQYLYGSGANVVQPPTFEAAMEALKLAYTPPQPNEYL